jgi:hypothetical protein
MIEGYISEDRDSSWPDPDSSAANPEERPTVAPLRGYYTSACTNSTSRSERSAILQLNFGPNLQLKPGMPTELVIDIGDHIFEQLAYSGLPLGRSTVKVKLADGTVLERQSDEPREVD